MKQRRPKYGNSKVEYQGMSFDSKREMQRYIVLKEAEERGLISDLRTQVVFELVPSITEEHVKHLKTKDKIETRVAQRAILYKADFVYKKDGKEVIEDVKVAKGLIPKEFTLKEKLFFWRFGKKIKLVFKPNDEI
jgi:hypothetical protein